MNFITFDYEMAKNFVLKHGIDVFVQMLEEKYDFQINYYSSLWLKDKQLPCILRGEKDLIIGWEGIHNFAEPQTISVFDVEMEQYDSIARSSKSEQKGTKLTI